MLEDGLESVKNLMDKKDDPTEAELDTVGAKYLEVVYNVSFSDVAIYTVELSVSKHQRPEVKEAKGTEVNNLLDYDVFEEVEDVGQQTIGSRWIVTSKENTKAWLVARGFQETLKPQSDSPTVSKESFKLLLAVVANSGFKLASVDI